MIKYRIIYIKVKNDPCRWQAQERVFFIWKNIGGRYSSPTTAANEITDKAH